MMGSYSLKTRARPTSAYLLESTSSTSERSAECLLSHKNLQRNIYAGLAYKSDLIL